MIFLEDEGFKGVDSYSRAYILSCAVRKIGEFDIILTGMQTSDWGFSQVGIVLAEILKIPSIAMAQSIAIEENKVVVRRALKQGYRMEMAESLTISRSLYWRREPTPGHVIHTVGYPHKPDTYGGGFIYGMADRHVSIGLYDRS